MGEDAREAGEPITKADLLDAGLIGDGSVSRRAALVKALDLPEHISTNALLDVLNLIWTRDTFFEKTCKK